jgi:MYXO-CTERM domain-containing protein
MEVCRGGLCVPGCDRCDGVVCGGGLMCTTAGTECSDPSCATSCPAGTFCRMGSCVDDCDGAVCPRHEICMNGECVVPPPMPGVDAGIHGTDAATTGMDAGPIDAAIYIPPVSHRGCGCGVGASRGGLGALGLLALLALRRRRVSGAARGPSR